MSRVLKYLLVAILTLISFNVEAQINRRYIHYLGQELIVEGEYEGAIDALNVLLRVDKNSYNAYFLRGVAKYNLGDYIGAESDFTSAININPVYTIAYHYRAITRSYLGNYDDSLDDFAKAIDIRPDQEGLYYSRGITFYLSQQFKKAIADFDHYLRRKPNTVDAYVNRGTSYLMLQDTVKALNDFNRAVKTNRFDASGFFRRGSLYLQQEKFTDAYNDLTVAIKLDSTYVLSYFNRALVHNSLHQPLDAINDLNKVIELDSTSSITYFNRALLLSQIGDYNNALKDYDMVSTLSPNNVLLYFNRGGLNNQLGEVEKAEEDFTKAIELYPDFANAYINRSAVRHRMGKMKESKIDYDIAQRKIKEYREKMTDSTFSIYADTSKVFSSLLSFNSDFSSENIDINTISEDKTDLSSMNRFTPTTPKEVFELKSQQYINEAVNKEQAELQEFGLSISTFDDKSDEEKIAADEMNLDNQLLSKPNDKRLNFAKGVFEHSRRQYSNAIRLYSIAIKQDPMNAFYYMNRAVADAEMIEFVSQIDNQSHSLVIDADPVNQLKNVKRTYNYDSALNDINKAIMLNPNVAQFHYNKASILTLSGDLVSAIESYTKAIELHPYMSEAYLNRGVLQIKLKETKKGFLDISHAGELGNDKAYEIIKRYGNILKNSLNE